MVEDGAYLGRPQGFDERLEDMKRRIAHMTFKVNVNTGSPEKLN